MKKTFYITAIDTDAGKTLITGLMARYLKEKGLRVITQKMVQTGHQGISEDIVRHRQLMGTGLLSEDHQKMTCPYVFSFPGSPHLAAAMEKQTIDPHKIYQQTRTLSTWYEYLLLEGTGGLMVPLTKDYRVIDYFAEYPAPLILVAHSRLGSINHTLLSIEACHHRKLNLLGIIYNQWHETDPEITRNSEEIIGYQLKKYYPRANCIPFPQWTPEKETPDFSFWFGR